MEMSCKRLGMTIVANDEGMMLGVITDGDIRRGVEKWAKDFYDMKAGDMMTKNPRTIAGEELAAKALSVMEELSITSLAVPDGSGKAKGVIHLHDILRKGIA